jgi:hypothetical protein
MQKVSWKYLTTFATGFTLALGLSGLASAHEGHDHGAATHGGVEAKTKRHHFEVVFSKTGVKLYAHGPDQEAVDLSRAAARATFYHPSTPEKSWFERELRPTPASPGQAPASLDLALDLGNVPASGVKVAFQVSGLPDPEEPTAQFTVPFALGNSGEITVTKATQADQATIKVQRLCKVSGEELGSMGVPFKVTRGNKSILICCQGCVKAIKADPEKFFGAQASAATAKGDQDHKH